jgi:hypothetical protein
LEKRKRTAKRRCVGIDIRIPVVFLVQNETEYVGKHGIRCALSPLPSCEKRIRIATHIFTQATDPQAFADAMKDAARR